MTAKEWLMRGRALEKTITALQVIRSFIPFFFSESIAIVTLW